MFLQLRSTQLAGTGAHAEKSQWPLGKKEIGDCENDTTVMGFTLNTARFVTARLTKKRAKSRYKLRDIGMHVNQ